MVAARLIGRESELASFEVALVAVRETGQKLLVRGDPGIGKSALLNEVAARAAAGGFEVYRLTGYQSEARYPLAGLQQLLRPLADRMAGLPESQRAAIESAFGEAPEAEASFLISLATLNLLSDAAAKRPVLVIAEDAQWFDPPTCEALAFVSRRLESDSIFLVLSARTGHTGRYDSENLPEMQLAGLDEDSAYELLQAHGRVLSESARGRVVRESHGNPLALVELSLTATLASAAAPMLTENLPLTARLERVFSDRATTLERATQELLLVAALNSACTSAEALAAATIVVGEAVSVAALTPAIAAGLLVLDKDRLQFRHPLVRSAIQQAATDDRRFAAHAALATVLTEEPDRSLWHRASSTFAPDEFLAEELEQAATRSRKFRDVSVAVATFTRAAELSPAPADRAARLLLAAESAFEMGRSDMAEELLAEAELLDLTPSLRIRIAWSREAFGMGVWSGAAGLRTIIGTIDEMRMNGDSELALRSLFAVAERAFWTNPDEEVRQLIGDAAARLDAAPDDPMMIVLTATADPPDNGRRVLEQILRRAPDTSGDPDVMRTLGVALAYIGALDEAARYFAAAEAGLRAQGRLLLVAETLTSEALTNMLRGHFSAAAVAADECDRLTEETGQLGVAATTKAITAVLAALRGESERALAAAAEVEQIFAPLGANPQLWLVEMVRATVATGENRPADAFAHWQRAFDTTGTAYHPYLTHGGIMDFAESAIACGRRDEVREALRPYFDLGSISNSQVLHAHLTVARPLLASDEEADALFVEALASEHLRWPFARARLQLAYGMWLRQMRRVTDSRAPLRNARDAFDALGASVWAERARRTLRATGETSEQPVIEGLAQLTSQELQVVELAAAGLTNREIGERLFLSHRTVGVHLYRAFPKMGISSRSQIRGVLDRSRPVEEHHG